MESRKPILYVENDKADVITMQMAFQENNIKNLLEIVRNGEEALEYLRNPKTEDPCIILLDLNLPRMNGIEFLNIVKKDEKTKEIPVVMITTSEEEQGKRECFKMGVAGYLVKSDDFDEFSEMIRNFYAYWTMCSLPNR